MRLLQYLQETYVTLGEPLSWRGEIPKSPFPIFCNPTAKELREIGNKDIRYLVDFKYKKLYVWDADFTHQEAMPPLTQLTNLKQVANSESYYNSIVTGTARLVSSKLKMTDPEYGYAGGILPGSLWPDMDDKWLNTWFTRPFIESYKEIC
jgi:hypothetical protein